MGGRSIGLYDKIRSSMNQDKQEINVEVPGQSVA